MKISLVILLVAVFGLVGCSNQDGRYNVNNSWCAEKVTPKIEKITLSADVLFKFNKSSIADMLPAGKTQLDELTNYLSKNKQNINTIKIIGYTDRLGSDNYNIKLGLERANAINDYLINNGVNVEYIVESQGKQNPVTNGCHSLTGESLRSCLQPDRRVELFIESNK